MTYKIDELYKIENCKKCYKVWQDTLKIKDSRNIIERVKDVLE